MVTRDPVPAVQFCDEEAGTRMMMMMMMMIPLLKCQTVIAVYNH